MTPYALLLQACGLSQREAADLHDVRLDTVKSWAAGRREAPPAAIGELRALWWRIRSTANKAIEAIRARRAPGAVDDIEIPYPETDEQARALGLPCVGAWRAVTAIVIAKVETPIRLVARARTGGKHDDQ